MFPYHNDKRIPPYSSFTTLYYSFESVNRLSCTISVRVSSSRKMGPGGPGICQLIVSRASGHL